MGFLIRMTFWFSLVLLVLPLDPEGGDGSTASVSPFQALFAAREAVGDVAGICDRKPEVCETGKAAIQTITIRARESARIALEMIDEQEAEPSAETTGSVAAAK